MSGPPAAALRMDAFPLGHRSGFQVTRPEVNPEKIVPSATKHFSHCVFVISLAHKKCILHNKEREILTKPHHSDYGTFE